MADDVAMDDMEIDFTMDEDPEIARLQAEAAAINSRSEAEAAEAMKDVEEVKEEGEFDPNETQPTKVHVRGVDRLNTNQIEQWVAEHAGTDLFRKVQWIDDNSANLIFDTEIAAADALNALSATEGDEPLDLRRAKDATSHPDQVLQVRLAIVTDVKTRGAKDRSAFYLFNPEWDPDNPNNVRHDHRKRRWADDGGRERNKYRRREWEDDRLHRRGSRDQGNFTEDMYDEGAGTSSAPPESRRSSGTFSTSDRPATPPANAPRELFPDMQGTPNHRRQDGRDLPLDEVVHFMGARPSSTSRANQSSRSERGQGAKGDLFARVGGGDERRGNGRLSRPGEEDDAGFSIKGSARNGDGGEFSFLGASGQGQRTENPLVKELFPLKNGERKDLFDGRIKGRASGRRRAEDLF